MRLMLGTCQAPVMALSRLTLRLTLSLLITIRLTASAFSMIVVRGQLLRWLRGKKEGRKEGKRSLIIRQLNRRIGNVSSEMEAQIAALPLEQLETLGEAQLDFTTLADLDGWLTSRN